MWCVQDTIIVIPPYPYSIAEEIDDVPFDDCWYARPQLFFQCHLRPAGGRPPKNPSYKIGPDDLLFNLLFFSTFEELNLPIQNGTRKYMKVQGLVPSSIQGYRTSGY